MPPDDPTNSPVVIDTSAKDNQIAELNKQLATLKAEQEKRSSEDKKKKDEAAVKRGEHEKLLSERTAELESIKKNYESMQATLQARADSMFEKLPDESKKKIERYKDKLSLADWQVMIEEEIDNPGKVSDSDPIEKKTMAITPGSRGKRSNRRELQPKTYEVMEDRGLNHEAAEALKVVKNPENPGDVKFSMTLKNFYDRMKAFTPAPWTREEAERRR
jgi:chromosome segregation ATPase